MAVQRSTTPLSAAVIDPAEGFAFLQLRPSGFNCPLETLSPLWAVSIAVMDHDDGPTAYPRSALRRAAAFVDQILIIPHGEGFVSGQRVGGAGLQYQAGFLKVCEQLLRANRRCLAIRTNPSRLAEWEAVLHFLAPHVPVMVWRPEAIDG